MSDNPSNYEVEREGFVDALDHIARVARASRTQTRRLRWIESRARCAIEGGEDWRDIDLPPSAESASKRIFKLLSERAELAQRLADAERVIDDIRNSELRKLGPVVAINTLDRLSDQYRKLHPKEEK